MWSVSLCLDHTISKCWGISLRLKSLNHIVPDPLFNSWCLILDSFRIISVLKNYIQVLTSIYSIYWDYITHTGKKHQPDQDFVICCVALPEALCPLRGNLPHTLKKQLNIPVSSYLYWLLKALERCFTSTWPQFTPRVQKTKHYAFGVSIKRPNLNIRQLFKHFSELSVE